MHNDYLTHYGHFWNGATSITISLALTQPVTTMKTFIQMGKHPSLKSSQLLNSIRQLYAGFFPNALSGGIAESIAFMNYHYFKEIYQDSNGKLAAGQNLILSSFSGILGSPANAFFEQLMIRQQLYKGSLLSHFNTIYKRDGLCRGLFKGSFVTAGRDMGFNLGIFAFNDLSKQALEPFISDPLTHETSSGLLAGAIAGFITNPFDRVKTIIQGDLQGAHTTFRATTKKIIETEKIKSLFQGSLARSLNISLLVCAISMLKQRIPPFLPDSCKTHTNPRFIC